MRRNSIKTGHKPVSTWNAPGLRGIAIRILAFMLLWWVLTEGGSVLSVLGVLGVGLAVLASCWLLPPRTWPLRPLAVVRFLPFFLWQSLLGGWDVALRAIRFRVDVGPIVITHVFALESQPARVLFLWVVSLLPGTAAMDLLGDRVRIHVLDQRIADTETLRGVERRIASLFTGR